MRARRLPALLLTATAALMAGPVVTSASAYTPRACSARFVPQELIVKYEAGTPKAEQAAVRRETGTRRAEGLPGGSQRLQIVDGETVGETAAELRREPGVEYAVPNYNARASALVPNDPGQSGRPGGWAATQWNFAGAFSVNAPDAWEIAARAGAPGGRGAVVAVIDTGIAYQTRGRYRRAPDFAGTRFRRGYDFVDRDAYANDANGHGTHVAGTIAEATNNGRAVTGLAYGASVIPLRVLDECGVGNTAGISRAIRFAADRGADVINLSLEFEPEVRAAQIPDVLAAVRYASRRGALLVAASGNDDDGNGVVAYPARGARVVSVGATTDNGCQAYYSNSGAGLDVAAPGGGPDAAGDGSEWDRSHCNPIDEGRFIYQQTFSRSLRSFGLPRDFEGTSMATPHVAATAALLIAVERRRGNQLTPEQVEARIKATARDLGPPGPDSRYGAGLIDAAAALQR